MSRPLSPYRVIIFDEVRLRQIVPQHDNKRSIILAMGVPDSTTTRRLLVEAAIRFGVNLPNKTGGDFTAAHRSNKIVDDIRIFALNGTCSKGTVKRRFREVSEYVCALCEMLPIWRGIPLTLQMDHINGNNKDHRVENLRWLCPNCHSQTDTFGTKNAVWKENCKVRPKRERKPLQHGTKTDYNKGCRCAPCTEANKKYHKERRQVNRL